MKPVVIILLSVLHFYCAPGAVCAGEKAPDNPESVFRRANSYYDAGDYDMAISEDMSILRRGLKNGNLYYNLGNFYFKNGELGKAVVNYERAMRFMPRDSDLLSNLEFAKSLMKQPDPPGKRARVLRMLDAASRYLTLKEIILLILFCWYLLITVFIVTKVFKRFVNYSTIILVLLCSALALLIVPLPHRIADYERGTVAIDPITDVRFEPFDDADVNFPLYEGMKVRILRRDDNWLKIKRPDGKIGWIPKEKVELIGM
jgi:tetratricopeptide (TPR) repeat protein